LLSDNFGPGVARQIGLVINDLDYIFFIDNDILVQEGCIESLIKEIEGYDNVIGVCAKVVEDGHSSLNGMLLDGVQSYYVDDEINSREIDFSHGGAILYKADVVNHARFVKYFCEDWDFSLQLKHKGFKLRNCPDALCIHIPNRNAECDIEYNKVRRDSVKLREARSKFYKKWNIRYDAPRMNDNTIIYEKNTVVEPNRQAVLEQDKHDPSLYYVRKKK
jgi:GT2 family glycosyltransferase